MEWFEELPVVSLWGMELSLFGIYCAAGALCAVCVCALICRNDRLKKGSGSLLGLMSLFFGLLFSRLTFCLLTRETGGFFPLSAWPALNAGGWSLMGGIFGAFFGAYLCARLIGQQPALLLDAVSCGLPLFIAAERLSEESFDFFDVSRILGKELPQSGWLIEQDTDYGVSYLATYRIAAVLAICLFLYLAVSVTGRRRQQGGIWIRFMVLTGAFGVLLESLRYDHFLEFSFVCFQQVLAACLLLWGVILACKRAGRQWLGLKRTALISFPLTVGICIGLEFALDRTGWSHILIYIIMVCVLAVPAASAMILLRKAEKGMNTP